MKNKLTKTGLLFILIALLSGCGEEEKTSKWINEHPKPIRCLLFGNNGFDYNKYTLIDANGDVYNTGWIGMALPDTIGKK